MPAPSPNHLILLPVFVMDPMMWDASFSSGGDLVWDQGLFQSPVCSQLWDPLYLGREKKQFWPPWFFEALFRLLFLFAAASDWPRFLLLCCRPSVLGDMDQHSMGSWCSLCLVRPAAAGTGACIYVKIFGVAVLWIFTHPRLSACSF